MATTAVKRVWRDDNNTAPVKRSRMEPDQVIQALRMESHDPSTTVRIGPCVFESGIWTQKWMEHNILDVKLPKTTDKEALHAWQAELEMAELTI